MIIPILIKEEPSQLILQIKAYYPLQMRIALFDPRFPNTFYYKRKVNFKLNSLSKSLTIPLVTHQNHLQLVLLENEAKQAGFEIEDITIKPLSKPNVWATPERHRYMSFAIDFAKKAGYLNPGYYPSRQEEFLIEYKPVIRDAKGNILPTPARINQKMPRVQLSKAHFKTFSIPVRVAILAHEGCHYFKNTRSEEEADLCGLRYYLDAGFPAIEAVYALTKVIRLFNLPIEHQHLKRTQNSIAFIEYYTKNKPLLRN